MVEDHFKYEMGISEIGVVYVPLAEVFSFSVRVGVYHQILTYRVWNEKTNAHDHFFTSGEPEICAIHDKWYAPFQALRYFWPSACSAITAPSSPLPKKSPFGKLYGIINHPFCPEDVDPKSSTTALKRTRSPEGAHRPYAYTSLIREQNLAELWHEINAIAQTITEQELPYSLLTRNSNSFFAAITQPILERKGLKPPCIRVPEAAPASLIEAYKMAMGDICAALVKKNTVGEGPESEYYWVPGIQKPVVIRPFTPQRPTPLTAQVGVAPGLPVPAPAGRRG